MTSFRDHVGAKLMEMFDAHIGINNEGGTRWPDGAEDLYFELAQWITNDYGPMGNDKARPHD